MTTRTYTELIQRDTFEDRFRYLALGGSVAERTFGSDRWINQNFYQSYHWRNVRNYVIDRDEGCDLGVPGFEIHARLYIHHMNPVTLADLIHGNDDIIDPEFLITTSHRTHNAIHYGDERQLPRLFVPRKPGDTKLW